MIDTKWYMDTAVELELKADEQNDSYDHDELHAASVIAYTLSGHNVTIEQWQYVTRWLEGLRGR